MNHPIVFLDWDNKADLPPAYFSWFWKKFIGKKNFGYKVPKLGYKVTLSTPKLLPLIWRPKQYTGQIKFIKKLKIWILMGKNAIIHITFNVAALQGFG